MVIHGKHKRYDLALRRRAKLEKQYGYAKILSRRSSAGKDSPRGHYYRFQVGKPKKNREYLVIFEYKKKNKIIHYDYAVIYKRKATKKEILDFIYRSDVPPPDESEVLEFAKGRQTNAKKS